MRRKLLILVLLFIINTWYANDEENSVIDIRDEINLDLNSAQNWTWLVNQSDSGTWDIDNMSWSIILDTNSWAEEIEVESQWVITDAINKRKEELEKVIEKSSEEKDIDYVKWLLEELDIKRELNNSFVKEVKDELNKIQENIDANNEKITQYDELENKNVEINLEITNLKKENQRIKQEAFFKQSLINDLNNSLDSYKILEVKYNNILDNYVKAKKEKQQSDLDVIKSKLFIFYIWIVLFLFVYFLKILIAHYWIIKKNKWNFFVYFDLLYTIFLIIFIIAFLFYLFPQLYILLIFVSWSIIWANSVLISSFVSSLIIFKKFSVWEVIKMDWEYWKIIRITPLNVVIKKVNEYWILENEEINMPNINLIKDKISILKDLNEKDHHFSIILPLKNDFNLFKIIDFIKENILLKNISKRPNTVNKEDSDIFKTKYEQIDAKNIKINFFWIWSDEFNRKIEKKIIWYLESIMNDSGKIDL